MNISLTRFTNKYAEAIANWPADTEEAKAWAGQQTPFPLSSDQFQQWHAESDVQAFVGLREATLVAYGEMWIDADADGGEVELARIIVEPSHRGIGVGRAFVTMFVNLSRPFGFTNILLRVLPENIPAIRCYQAAGFSPVSTEEQAKWNEQQPCSYLWMKYNG